MPSKKRNPRNSRPVPDENKQPVHRDDGCKSIEVLSFEECGNTVKDDLRAAIKKLKDPNYETMVNANEEGNRTKVMVRIDKDIIRELVILTTDGGDDALIRIKGKIKPSDIEKVINDHKDGC